MNDMLSVSFSKKFPMELGGGSANKKALSDLGLFCEGLLGFLAIRCDETYFEQRGLNAELESNVLNMKNSTKYIPKGEFSR